MPCQVMPGQAWLGLASPPQPAQPPHHAPPRRPWPAVLVKNQYRGPGHSIALLRKPHPKEEMVARREVYRSENTTITNRFTPSDCADLKGLHFLHGSIYVTIHPFTLLNALPEKVCRRLRNNGDHPKTSKLKPYISCTQRGAFPAPAGPGQARLSLGRPGKISPCQARPGSLWHQRCIQTYNILSCLQAV